MVQGTPGQISVFDKNSLALLNSFPFSGANIPESKSTVQVLGGKALIAAGTGGLQVLSINTGEVVGTVPVPTVPGLDSSVVVTNAVSADEELVFISNGEAGVYLAEVAEKFEDTGSEDSQEITLLGKLRFDNLQSVNHVAYKSDMLFVAAGLGGLKIVWVVPAEQVLEQNTSGGDKIDVKIDQKGAQEFWHGDPGDPDYQITKIVLHLSRDKDEPDGDLSFSLGTGVNSGAITGSAVAFTPSQVIDSEGNSFMPYEAVYETVVGPLTAGTKYYLNFENEAGNGKSFYLEYASSNTYANGTYYKAGSDEEKDAWFQVWGVPAGPE